MTRIALVIEPGYASYTHEEAALAPHGFTVVSASPAEEPELFEDALSKAEIVFVRDYKIGAADIARMKNARGIVRYGVGVDTVDLEAAKANGIVVTRVNDYGADIEVADHAVSLFLALKRRIVTRDRDVRRGAWQVDQDEPIHRIAGSTLGLLGYGRIAQAVKKRLAGFGVNHVISYDPFITSAENVELVSIEELAERSDILSLHAPANNETRGIINEAFLRRMKPHSVLINTSRGPLIDDDALYSALKEGRIFGAALDVFGVEPPVNSPLLTLPNVVATDHCGWYSEATVQKLQIKAAEQAVQIIETGTASSRVV